MTNEFSYSSLISRQDVPVITIDYDGVVTYINSAFELAYGWHKPELVGQVVTIIMPPYMRDAHNFGFSRFLTTESPRILGTPLPLPVHCKNGDIVDAQHVIVGEKYLGKWRFAATIEPVRDMHAKI